MPVSTVGASGGVLAKGSTIDLYERTKVTYTLDSPIIISKLTFIEAHVENIEEARGLKICPSEKIASDLPCDELPLEITSEDKIRFSHTTLLARFITFEQISGRSKISNIKLVTYQKGVIDDNGECVDDNAHVDASQGRNQCICKPSFVVWESLNEDKALNNVLDFCRSCADTEKCSYDGGLCEDGKYSCYDNKCDSGICTPEVRHYAHLIHDTNFEIKLTNNYFPFHCFEGFIDAECGWEFHQCKLLRWKRKQYIFY